MTGKARQPNFILLAAISLDGKITTGRKEGSEWTSKEDKVFFRHELDRADAVVMGRKTFEAIKHPLTSRNRLVFSRRKIFSHSAECQNIFGGSAAELLRLLGQNGWHRIAIVGGTAIYDWFLKRDLVDEMYLTLEPLVFGNGKPLVSRRLNLPRKFRLASVKKLNARGTLLLHYQSLQS